MENPIVFISYSWDDEPHKTWVLNLANKLRADGIDVILDQYHLQPGANISVFVEESLRKCNRIIIVLTEKYNEKATKRVGGVGQEFSLINTELISNIGNNERVIPLLKSGNSDSSVPAFLKQYIYVDFTNNEAFTANYETLIREIYKEPEVKIPELGKKPQFDSAPKIEKNNEVVRSESVPNNEELATDSKAHIRNLVGQARTEEALELLAKNTIQDSDLYNRVVMIKSRLTSFKREKNMGLLRSDEAIINSNQINNAVLSLLDEL